MSTPHEINKEHRRFWASITYDAKGKPIAPTTTPLLRWDRYGAAQPRQEK